MTAQTANTAASAKHLCVNAQQMFKQVYEASERTAKTCMLWCNPRPHPERISFSMLRANARQTDRWTDRRTYWM